MLQFKSIGMKRRTPCEQIVYSFTHPRPLDGVRRSNKSEGHAAKERSVEHYARKMIDLMHTPDLLGWVKKSDIEIVQIRVYLFELSDLIGFGYGIVCCAVVSVPCSLVVTCWERAGLLAVAFVVFLSLSQM